MQCNQTLWGVKHRVSYLWIFLQVSCHELPLWVFDSWCGLQLLPLQPKSNLANSSHSTWHVLFLQCAYFSFQQLHSIVENNYMNISFESHAPSSTHWIHLKNTLPLHRTLDIWCSHPSPSPPLLWNSKNVETLHLCVSWGRPTPSLCGHQWNSRSICILQWILSSWSTHLSGSFPKVWNLHELFELGMDA